ncbi:polyphosphate--glucose phosphotransferase [Zhihengliuella flava]|uniref:Polyphosphate glucokinase n=1 Tax=Zhihengliuella flava TaxID=1285193 RepID=A0A931DBQ5_9MICC|nr:ROK family protein [Zhihengliuella flava]MBG6085648.1 polyphosphate glucokinase [Zhihengliuella flava]
MAKDTTKDQPRTAIGIDIGGTGMKGGIVDLAQGTLLGDRFRIPTPKPATPEAVADVLAEIVDELMLRQDAPDPTTPIGAAFPAIIDDGVARSAANVDKSWIDADVDGIFSARLNREIHVINDADAAGLAEARYGAGQGVDGSVLAITLGTGIGSAMLYNGSLIPNFELGHLELDGHDAETRASASAREREDLPWDEYAQRLQRYFEHVEFLFSPKLFIVGGGISKRAEDYLPLLNLRTPIEVAKLKNNAGIVGAALQAALHFKLLA